MNGKLLLIFFLIPILLFANCKSVEAADNKEYSIDNVNFDVQLNEDGSATVCENWNVNFTKGEFTRFYKDINRDVTNIEKFSSVSDVKVYIDGKDCKYTEDTNSRPDGKYNFAETPKAFTISAYFNANNQQKTFKFEYTLKDVVKEVDGNGVFCYRFIGADFKNRCDNVHVTIYAPHSEENANINVLYGEEYLKNSEKNNISFYKDYVPESTVFKLKVSMPAVLFHGLKHMDESDPDESGESSVSITPFIGLAIMASFCLLIVYIFNINKRRFKKNMIEARGRINNEPIENVVSRILSEVTPVQLEVLILSKDRNKTTEYFMVTVLDLMRKGFIYEHNNLIYIKVSHMGEIDEKSFMGSLKVHEVEVLKILLKTGNTVEYGNTNINPISLNELNKALMEKPIDFYKNMNNLYSLIYKDNDRLNHNESLKKAIINDGYTLLAYMEVQNYSLELNEIIYKLLNNKECNILEIYKYIFLYNEIKRDTNYRNNNEEYYNMGFYGDFESMIYLTRGSYSTGSNLSSSSSGSSGDSSSSGGSSCSSCSGCGGGGAD